MDGFRLSPQQRRLWPLVADDPAPYRAVAVLALNGPVDRGALAAALSDVVARYEILRTSFTLAQGLTLPVQTIHDPSPVRLEEPTAQSPESDRLLAIDSLLSAADRSRSAVAVGLRAVFAPALSGGELLISVPGLCLDAVGLDIVVAETAARYAARVTDGPDSGEAYQYADLAAWQNDLLESPGDGDGRAYWRNHRRRGPIDWSVPFVRDTTGTGHAVDRVSRTLNAATSGRLDAVAEQLGVRSADLLLASWVMVLRRAADRTDGVVGVRHDGRAYAELAEAPGLFSKFLPLDDDFSLEEAFGQATRRIHQTITEQDQWQDYFNWDDWAPGEDLGRARRFTFGFAAEPAYLAVTAGGVNFRVIDRSTRQDRFTLCGDSRQHEGMTVLGVSYDTQVVERTAVERLTEGWIAFVEAAVDDLEHGVGDLPVVGSSEAAWVRSQNATTTPYPTDLCIHDLIRDRAAEYPDRPAVVYDGGELSFGELMPLADGLAWRLQSLGVKADDRVALCARRGPELIIGLLGILNAGAAYVPVDPDYPADRLEQILRDASPTVLVGSREALESLPPTTVPRLDLDDVWTSARAETAPVSVHPDNLAYVIYTSGSTGTPKGVMVTHRNLVNSTYARMTYFPTPVSRFLLLASFAFDSSVAGIFWTLCQGGALVLPKPGLERHPAEIAAHIHHHHVSHITLLPSLYSLLLEAAGPGQLASVKMGYVGGDVCPQGLVDLHRRRLAGVPLYHAYGPTENTVWSTVQLVGDTTTDRVPIGHPIANVRVSLNDRRLQPVQTGVPGEVCLGGVSLARGYLSDPALTAQRFVPDPLALEPGSRMYRTGDLALRRDDGALEYVGRADQQVKVRGYRIELGDIEAALRRHAAVDDVVVTAREDTPGDRRLVAYVVGKRSDTQQKGYRLPNGLLIEHFDKFQTDAQYRLIFEEDVYTQHGVTIRPGDCVFDVGANIGLFSLYAWTRCPDIRVFSFEPVPATFEKLRANVTDYGLDAQLFQYAIGANDGEADIRFYPALAGMSGLHADPEADRHLARAVVGAHGDAWRSDADQILDERFDSQVLTCQVRRLSSVWREIGVPQIDLLKVDVEKSEEAVLDGIDADDWSRIRQVVVEVHDLNGRLDRVVADLERRQFRVEVDRSGPTGAAGLATVYAVSPDRDASVAAAATVATGAIEDFSLDASALRLFASTMLPAFMIPSAFVQLDALPRLPNGKVDRSALPPPESKRPAAGQAYVAPRSALERTLADIWAKALTVDHVGVDDNFFERGGDSILAVRVATLARQHSLWLTPRHLFQHQTVAELAKVADAAKAIEAAQGVVTGSVPLTPVQQWFFSLQLSNPHLFNMSTTVSLERGGGPDTWAQVVKRLLAHHDAFRLRFTADKGEWSARVVGVDESVPLTFLEVDALSAEEKGPAIDRALAETHGRINIESGPLVWFLLVRTGAADPDRLIVVAHHLVTDVVSWQVLLDDIRAGLNAASEGRPVDLPLKTSSVKRWADQLASLAELPDVLDELSFWHTQLQDDGVTVPLDHPEAENTIASAREVRATLDADATREVLTDVPRAYRAEAADVLLTALVASFARWSGRSVLSVDIESHGREETTDLDLSRTVGWFTSVYPVRLTYLSQQSPGEALMAVRAQLERIPRRGLSFGILRWMTRDRSAAALRQLPGPAVTFNYLGQLDPGIGDADAPFGFVRETEGTRTHVLEFDAYVRSGRLELTVAYSANLHERSTVDALAEGFIDALRELRQPVQDGLQTREASRISSFEWNRAELDDITAAIEDSSEDV